MSRKINNVLCALVTLLLVASSIQTASATAPQISVISINKSSVERGDSLVVQYRITDDGSCCNPHDVYMYDSSGAWVTRVQGSRISGTDQNSTWRADIAVPVNSVGQNSGRALAAGTYSFKTQTTDAQNNYSDLVLLGTVTVTVGTPTPSPSPAPTVPGEPDIEPEEDFVPSVEAKFVNGKTRLFVSGNPNTDYKLQATLRGNRKTYRITTNSDGEVTFRTSRNLRNYTVRLVLDGQIVARTRVR